MRMLLMLVLLAVGLVATATAIPGNYDRSIANVLISEGGYSNDAHDPGGPTNYGITIYDARKYWRPGATAADVRAMPKAVALDIYRTRYWAPLRADELCSGLDYSLFDYGVNSGLARAGKVLRRTLVLPLADWHVSDQVIDVMHGRDCTTLIIQINDERLRFLRSLHTWPVFGRGWRARVASVQAGSLAMAGVHPLGLLPIEIRPAHGPGKAYAPDDGDDEPEVMP